MDLYTRGWMGRWMDGWVDGWVDGWMGGWVSGLYWLRGGGGGGLIVGGFGTRGRGPGKIRSLDPESTWLKYLLIPYS